MTAFELDEGAKILAAIMDDPSGIELAEAFFTDNSTESGLFRCYDYQYAWWRCDRKHQITLCGRTVGKTTGMIIRASAFPFAYVGHEMLITAPEMSHLRPITGKITDRIMSTRLCREMLRPGLHKGKQPGIKQQPQWEAEFRGGTRIVSRIPHRDGKAVKGQHPTVLLLDEGQDYPEPAWMEIIETFRESTPGSLWLVCGVTRGVRDTFYRATTGTDPNLPFHIHRYMAMHRPTWCAKERNGKIAMYGGTEANVDYRRNIYGEHGDASAALFVPARLMARVRIAESAWAVEYNESIYSCIKIVDDMVHPEHPVEMHLDSQLPRNHLVPEYHSYWAGLDVGYARDPSEILVFGELEPKKNQPILRLLARIHLMRISAEDQARVVKFLFDFYGHRLRRFGMDKTGNGLPLYQLLGEGSQTMDSAITQRVVGYHFSEKIIVDVDPVLDPEDPKYFIQQRVIDFSSDEARRLVDNGVFELPYDTELLGEWQGQVISYSKDTMSMKPGMVKMYGSVGAGAGGFHTLDAARMAVTGRALDRLDRLLNLQVESGPVFARFL
jgi:hypothetical protein